MGRLSNEEFMEALDLLKEAAHVKVHEIDLGDLFNRKSALQQAAEANEEIKENLQKLRLKKRLNKMVDSLELDEMEAMCSVLKQYRKAVLKHPAWPCDWVHASAIVAEESGELTKAALQHEYEAGSKHEVYKEAAQTGAMGFRFLVEMIQ